MVKHTQTICWQKPANCFSVFDHFMGLGLNPHMHKTGLQGPKHYIFGEDLLKKCQKVQIPCIPPF